MYFWLTSLSHPLVLTECCNSAGWASFRWKGGKRWMWRETGLSSSAHSLSLSLWAENMVWLWSMTSSWNPFQATESMASRQSVARRLARGPDTAVFKDDPSVLRLRNSKLIITASCCCCISTEHSLYHYSSLTDCSYPSSGDTSDFSF